MDLVEVEEILPDLITKLRVHVAKNGVSIKGGLDRGDLGLLELVQDDGVSLDVVVSRQGEEWDAASGDGDEVLVDLGAKLAWEALKARHDGVGGSVLDSVTWRLTCGLKNKSL